MTTLNPIEQRYDPSNLKILIIDDHAPIRKAIKRVVQSMEMGSICEASDGSKAITELDGQHFDLIICDLYMGTTSGFDVLRHIRERQIANDIPFIVVTGEASKEDIIKSSDLGADGYVLKPFQTEGLEAKVIQVLNKYHSPSPLLRLLRSGDKYVLEHDYEQAHSIFKSALALDAESARANHSIAVSLIMQGRDKVAAIKLEENIKESPSYYKNFVALADIHLNRGNYPEAIRSLTSELELHTKQPKRQALLAKLFLKQDETESAIQHYREALKEDAKFAVALLGMGNCFAKLGDLDKAIYYFKRTRRHHPKETRALEYAVRICLDSKQYKRAEMMLRDEKKKFPERLDVYSTLTKLYIAVDEHEKALATLEELFALDEENIEGLRLKGTMEKKLRLYEQAADTFTKIAKLEPSLQIYIAIGECFQKVEKHKKAIAALDRALIFDSENSKVFYLLSVSFMETKQMSKAYCGFELALKRGFPKKHCDKRLSQCLRAIRARHQRSKLIAS